VLDTAGAEKALVDAETGAANNKSNNNEHNSRDYPLEIGHKQRPARMPSPGVSHDEWPYP
jgi:hypothetical protein